MPELDLIVRNARVVTASDEFGADIGIACGVITHLAQRLELDAATEIDAAGRTVTPGGIDGHCHIDQPSTDGSACADDFASATRSAACGGTTTVIPFALQLEGMRLRDAVADYHRRAEGKALIDYAFHLIITDPDEQVLGQELPALIRDSYTSFKVYMTYDDMKLDDRQILDVLALARPQYLFLTEDDLAQPGFAGAKCICSPPPRDAANQQVIWDALANGTFQVFSSDHAPTRYDDAAGKKLHGEGAPFRYVPNGVPGLETHLALLYSAGVLEGRISAQQFVALTATNVARMYGLYPRKGTIAIGADADLVIWDRREVMIDNARLHHDVDYTPYQGQLVKARPGLTLSRGEVVWDGAAPIGTPGRGRFLPCEAPAPARPAQRHVTDFRPA
jgi:dihydroorotase-like cyclic amidohydrolase